MNVTDAQLRDIGTIRLVIRFIDPLKLQKTNLQPSRGNAEEYSTIITEPISETLKRVGTHVTT
jgi:hypothetical protein